MHLHFTWQELTNCITECERFPFGVLGWPVKSISAGKFLKLGYLHHRKINLKSAQII